MESRLRVANNAVHPLLLMFPLGLFAIAILLDVATAVGAPRMLATLAHWNILAGLVGGTVTVAVASIDTMSVGQAWAARIRMIGVLLDMWVLIVFAVIALIRLGAPDRGADVGVLLVEVFGLSAAGIGSWFGGRFGTTSFVARRAWRKRETAETSGLSKPPGRRSGQDKR